MPRQPSKRTANVQASHSPLNSVHQSRRHELKAYWQRLADSRRAAVDPAVEHVFGHKAAMHLHLQAALEHEEQGNARADPKQERGAPARFGLKPEERDEEHRDRNPESEQQD